jgi:hypothetical protein
MSNNNVPIYTSHLWRYEKEMHLAITVLFAGMTNTSAKRSCSQISSQNFFYPVLPVRGSLGSNADLHSSYFGITIGNIPNLKNTKINATNRKPAPNIFMFFLK